MLLVSSLWEKHLQKLKWNKKGDINIMPKKGYKQTKEHRKSISKSLVGNKRALGSKGPLGKHWKLSDETKKRMSKSRKGKDRSPFSEEWKRNMSESHKGQKAWNKNKKNIYSEKTKQKMRKPKSEETKRKISEAMKGRKAWNKGLINIYSKKTREKMSKAAILRIQNNLGPFKNTKPELKMKEILNSLDILFKHQFRLGNHLFDFHILNTNILIEVDGDYFHGNPKMFKKLNKMQLEMKQKDIKNKRLAKENGFIVLRFWENNILKNTEEVKSKLKVVMGR